MFSHLTELTREKGHFSYWHHLIHIFFKKKPLLSTLQALLRTCLIKCPKVWDCNHSGYLGLKLSCPISTDALIIWQTNTLFFFFFQSTISYKLAFSSQLTHLAENLHVVREGGRRVQKAWKETDGRGTGQCTKMWISAPSNASLPKKYGL